MADSGPQIDGFDGSVQAAIAALEDDEAPECHRSLPATGKPWKIGFNDLINLINLMIQREFYLWKMGVRRNRPQTLRSKVYKLGNESLLAPGAFQSSLSMDLSQALSLSINIYIFICTWTFCIQDYTRISAEGILIYGSLKESPRTS